MEQELLTLPEHLSSSPVFSGVRVTRSLYVCFVDRCLSCCTFSFGHCVVCSSSIYRLWLPLWYLQTLLISNLNEISFSFGMSVNTMILRAKKMRNWFSFIFAITSCNDFSRIKTFNSSFRYIDGVLALNASWFGDYLHIIYQNKPEVRDTTDTQMYAAFL